MCESLYRGNNTYFAESGGHACKCQHSNDTLAHTQAQMYIWKPHNCTLLDWDSKLFCQLLGGRKVLLSGDSTMQQTASTLTSLIKAGQGHCADNIYFHR